MDENCIGCDAKKLKLDNEQNKNERRDRISDLPDTILAHILSFLSTSQAVRTSVLSKRWLYVWCSLPTMYLGCRVPDGRKTLIDFVERALLLRTSDIQKFFLLFKVYSDSLRVNTWVFSAIRHKVQELHLYLDTITEPFVLPKGLFSCESLRVLEIWMSHFMQLPSLIFFSNLKILTLQFVLFPDKLSTQQLFSNCPVLEELKLVDCCWENVSGVCISPPMLKTLFVRDESNDPTIHRETNGCQIIVFGTSLKSLTYVGDLIYDYCFYNCSSLADIHFGVYKRGREVAYRANKLLRVLSNVRKLTLAIDVVEVLASAKELFTRLPLFHNLTHLEFDTKPVNVAREEILSILRNSPSLSFLEFKEGICLSKMDREENDDCALDPMPSCLSTCLNAIKICNYLGTEEQMLAIKCLLNNATVLERLVICFAESITLLKQQNARQEILLLPKRSIRCDIIFS